MVGQKHRLGVYFREDPVACMDTEEDAISASSHGQVSYFLPMASREIVYGGTPMYMVLWDISSGRKSWTGLILKRASQKPNPPTQPAVPGQRLGIDDPHEVFERIGFADAIVDDDLDHSRTNPSIFNLV